MSRDAHQVEVFDDPAAFTAAAADLLAADPVLTTVVASVTAQAVRDAAAGHPRPTDRPRWWAVVRRGDEGGHDVVGLAMRTAPHPPYMAYLLPMPDGAARALARALVARGEVVTAVGGAADAGHAFLTETAAATLAGGRVELARPERLYALGDGELIEPRPASGRLRPVGPADVDLVGKWLADFHRQADAQAGREPGEREAVSRADVERRIAADEAWVWEDAVGPGGAVEVVHLTQARPPAFGVVRIGPVLTPPEHRGRGYASAAVAAVSARALAAGHRACLFTDLDNPVSNRVYTALGYRGVADMATQRLADDG